MLEPANIKSESNPAKIKTTRVMLKKATTIQKTIPGFSFFSLVI